jgi:hypothetical protein
MLRLAPCCSIIAAKIVASRQQIAVVQEVLL